MRASSISINLFSSAGGIVARDSRHFCGLMPLSVEVEAQSMYEAAVLAVRSFNQHDCEPGGMN